MEKPDLSPSCTKEKSDCQEEAQGLELRGETLDQEKVMRDRIPGDLRIPQPGVIECEDEDDEEMVEPKAQDDLETENQDQKQEVKEGTLKNEKDFVTALKDRILQVVTLIGSFYY
ncbi:hypothetical protein llap_19477 [Limosa lapponica baueri]|uniref:Uncharacterized protein n=1 Tax=Limosa lapponica baueri TaxID=1758121 RepID=A0A2I0T8U0_LIMLA|nr:hypothetical protein llap_19477 [Limosa lapponica baueri]